MNTLIEQTQSPIMMTTHQQVEVALNPRRIRPVLHSFMHGRMNQEKQRGDSRTACHILDAKYEPGKYCSILYEVGEKMVIGTLTWPAREQKMTIGAAPLPTMQLYPFDEDPDMPALSTVMDGRAMQEILNENLPECMAGEERIVRCRATLLRYRLGKRGTLRYDLRLRNTQTGRMSKRTLFGKLYHSAEKAEAVYREMQMLTAANAGNRLVMARAALYIPELPMVLQAPVADSAPLELLLQQPPATLSDGLDRVAAGIRTAAAALAELHRSPVRTRRIRSVDAELEKLERRSRRVAATDTSTGAALYRLAQALPAWRAQLPAWGEEITVVHGDCKPSQFFLLPDGKTALLDFDHCGMADPASDVGYFLATLRQMGVKQILKQRDPERVADWQQWLAELEEIFLEVYMANRACHANFRQRAVCYQAMSLLRKALRSFARSTRSPLPALLVEEAWRVLDSCA